MAKWVGRARVDVAAECGVWPFCFIVRSEACRHVLHHILADQYSVGKCMSRLNLCECARLKTLKRKTSEDQWVLCSGMARSIAAPHRSQRRVVTLLAYLEEPCRREQIEEQVVASQSKPARGSRTSDRMYLPIIPHFHSLMASPRQQVIDKKQKVKIPIMIQSIEKQIPSHATLHSLLASKS